VSVIVSGQKGEADTAARKVDDNLIADAIGQLTRHEL
jgi:hypothetical protein